MNIVIHTYDYVKFPMTGSRPAIIFSRPNKTSPRASHSRRCRRHFLFSKHQLSEGNKTDNMTSCLYFLINQMRGHVAACLPPGWPMRGLLVWSILSVSPERCLVRAAWLELYFESHFCLPAASLRCSAWEISITVTASQEGLSLSSLSLLSLFSLLSFYIYYCHLYLCTCKYTCKIL